MSASAARAESFVRGRPLLTYLPRTIAACCTRSGSLESRSRMPATTSAAPRLMNCSFLARLPTERYSSRQGCKTRLQRHRAQTMACMQCNSPMTWFLMSLSARSLAAASELRSWETSAPAPPAIGSARSGRSVVPARAAAAFLSCRTHLRRDPWRSRGGGGKSSSGHQLPVATKGAAVHSFRASNRASNRAAAGAARRREGRSDPTRSTRETGLH